MRKPEWLKIERPIKSDAIKTERILQDFGINTVCTNACCPNKLECYKSGTATFLILGTTCTRSCKFCAIDKNIKNIEQPDPAEPENIASAIEKLNIDYVVLTMVTRDDLSDGGAEHLAKVIKKIREVCKENIDIEVLVSDFNGNLNSLKHVLAQNPDVFNHNVEMISRLYPTVRPEANYERSLKILKSVKTLAPNLTTKSGFMVGLGETEQEVFSLMDDLMTSQVEILTIGQYLSPSKYHHPVIEYVHPATFEKYHQYGLDIGIKVCIAGPFVRSSYRAKDARKSIITN
jgi:lipoyl synthase